MCTLVYAEILDLDGFQIRSKNEPSGTGGWEESHRIAAAPSWNGRLFPQLTKGRNVDNDYLFTSL
jgi:hypothetical protein